MEAMREPLQDTAIRAIGRTPAPRAWTGDARTQRIRYDPSDRAETDQAASSRAATLGVCESASLARTEQSQSNAAQLRVCLVASIICLQADSRNLQSRNDSDVRHRSDIKSSACIRCQANRQGDNLATGAQRLRASKVGGNVQHRHSDME
jgi:hypothetical protein